jgi:Uma2 family endonuclease
MTTTLTQLMTAEQFYDWCNRPENAARHYELERGKVVEMSRPGQRHGIVCGNVAYELNRYVRQRRMGCVGTNDSGIIWERDPDTVRGPDVVFYDRLSRYEDLNPKYAEDPPLLAVEVLSPNDRMNKVTHRIQQFLAWGVAVVWLVDPEDSTVAVYRPGQAPQVLDAGGELTDERLPEFRCRVADFFYMPADQQPPAEV